MNAETDTPVVRGPVAVDVATLLINRTGSPTQRGLMRSGALEVPPGYRGWCGWNDLRRALYKWPRRRLERVLETFEHEQLIETRTNLEGGRKFRWAAEIPENLR